MMNETVERKITWVDRLFRSQKFIAFLLLLIPVTEWIFYEYWINFEYYSVCCNPYFGIGIILTIILLVSICIGGVLHYFSISALTSYRFLSNAFGSRPLNLLFGFIFVMHLSWICDSAYNLVFYDNEVFSFLRLLLAIGGMIGIFIIFPTRKGNKKSIPIEKRTLLVMGLSEIKVGLNKDDPTKIYSNIEVAIKPFGKYKFIKKVVILLSENIVKAGDCIDINLIQDHEGLQKALKNYKEKIVALADSKEKIKGIKSITELDEEIIIPALRKIIQESIKYYYPQIENVDKIQILFTSSVDYDNFSRCYKVVDEALMRKEEKTASTIINISPGTAIVTSVMSIQAIKGDRQLVYTKQSGNKDLVDPPTNVWTLGQLMRELSHELMTDRFEE